MIKEVRVFKKNWIMISFNNIVTPLNRPFNTIDS